MAGKISWSIEIQGLDRALGKLKELDALLKRITGYKSNLFSGNTGNTGQQGGGGGGGGGGVGGVLPAGSNYKNRLSKKWGDRLADRQQENLKRQPEVMAALKSQGFVFKRTSIAKSIEEFSVASRAFVSSISGILAVIYLAKRAFNAITEAVENGAKAYQDAAKSGVGITRTSAMSNALNAIGINEKPTFQMQSATSAGGIIGAAKASGFGGSTQLINMSKEFAEALEDGADNARQMEAVSKSSQIISQEGSNIMREFSTLMSQILNILAPIIIALELFLKTIIKGWNAILELITFSGKGPGKSRFPGGGGGGGSSAITGWEKMGFVMGVGTDRATKHLANIDRNISKLVEKSFIGGGGRSGGAGASFSW
jgi:hypothetical protein